MHMCKKTAHASSYMVMHFMNIFEQLKKESESLQLSPENRADSREFLLRYMQEGGDEGASQKTPFMSTFSSKLLSGIRSLRTILRGEFGTIENLLKKKDNDRM